VLAVHRSPATISNRGWSAGLKQKVRRGRQSQPSRCRQGERATVRRQRHCRCRRGRPGGGQLDQRADGAISAERSVRLGDRCRVARQGRILRRRRRCRPGRSQGESIEMDVPERQYNLHRQREQRQAGTQSYVRPEPVHHYAFTTATPARLAQLAERSSRSVAHRNWSRASNGGARLTIISRKRTGCVCNIAALPSKSRRRSGHP
jgi:hypothetical protein